MSSAASSSPVFTLYHRHLRVPYEQLVEKRQFDRIMDVLLKETKSNMLRHWLEGKFSNSSKASIPIEHIGETALHRIAVVQPPAWIVEALVKCMTELYHNSPLDVSDILGRTPLHIAAIHGSTDAMPILTNGSTISTAPLIQDKWLRCPLHWACTHPIRFKNTRGKNDTTGNSVNENTALLRLICHPRTETTDMFTSVRTILAAYPEATIIRDSDGKTPLELAIEHNADPSIIRMVTTMEQSIRNERDNLKCNSFWSNSNNEETLSTTNSESELFPDGFPFEISIRTSRTIERRYSTSQSSHFQYTIFEC